MQQVSDRKKKLLLADGKDAGGNDRMRGMRMSRGWIGIFAGIAVGMAAGIGIDRIGLKKVLEEKERELERYKENFFVLGEWLAMFERGQTIAQALRDRHVSSVGIYGMGILGSHLYRQLEQSGVQVTYLIDKNPLKGIYHAKTVLPDAVLQDTDAIIVTPVYHFEQIKETLRQHNQIEVISLKELINREDV